MSSNRNQPPPQQQSLATRGQAQQGLSRPVSGTLTRLDGSETKVLTTTSAEEASIWLEEANRLGHVVAPGQSVPVMPEGRGIVVSMVRVSDFASQGTQLYPIPGSKNLGLHKNVLDDIGRAFGIDWPPEWTFIEKFGDERDQNPYCLKVTVAGRYRKYDGGWTTLPSLTKEIDLRDGSAEFTQIMNREIDKALAELPKDATEKAKEDRIAFGQKKAMNEILQLRKFLRAHAQTKARLMVIGTLVRRSYSPEELKKPFYVFQSIWTGRSDNPEIQKMFAQATIEMEMGARNMLYGASAAPPRELPAVSDQPSEPPFNAEAELAEYEKVVAAAETLEQTSDVKLCTPDACFGAGSQHVKACFTTVPEVNATGTAATQEPPASASWVVPAGRFANKRLSELGPGELGSLLDFYGMQLEDQSSSEEQREIAKAGHNNVYEQLQHIGEIK